MTHRLFLSFFALFVIESSICQAVTDQFPPSPERINKAVALMGQFNFKEAHLLFQELADEYPEHLDLQVNRAIALLNRQLKNDEEEALKILETVLEKAPSNQRARYCSALLLLHAGQLDAALNNFTTLLKAIPDDADLLYFTGKTYMQLNMYEEAHQYFSKAVTVDPYLNSAYYSDVMTLRHLGRNSQAKEMVLQYKKMKNNPRSRTAAFKYTKMGQLAEVIPLDGQSKPAPLPPGNLFEQPTEITLNHELPSALEEKYHSEDITIADINGDGFPDLFIPVISNSGDNLLLMGTENLSNYTVANDHPFVTVRGVNSVLWGDINDDGLLDGYFLCRGKNRLFLQSQDNTWVDVTDKSNTAGKSYNSVAGALFDADHDGDLDIFTVNENGSNELFNNNRNGTFKPLADEMAIDGDAQSVAILIQDIDQDRDADIIIINEHPPHQVHVNDRLWNYKESDYYSDFIQQDIVAATAGDIDADGEIELYTLSSNGILNRWSRSEKSLSKKKIITLQNQLSWDNTRMQIADCSGDGNSELLITSNKSFSVLSLSDETAIDIHSVEFSSTIENSTVLNTMRGPAVIVQDGEGKLHALAPGGGRYNFAMVQVTGRTEREANLRTNTSGIGASMLVRIGSIWSAADTFHNDFNRGQSSQPVTIGLAGKSLVDFIQIDWPDGVFQTEMALSPNKVHTIAETQRQMSSCPVLFAWDGSKFEFVSDLLGVGGIGYAIGPGIYADPRPWEHFLLPDTFAHPINGKMVVKMTEPMEEVEYLDSVSMTAYDLPPTWHMTLDERMGIMDPQPTGKPIFYRKSILPISAVNDRGVNVIDTLVKRDLKASPVGKLDRRFIGMLENFHTLTLSFTEELFTEPGRPVLVADGWVEYPYSQTSFAAWQAGAEYVAPSIEVKGKDGSWKTLLDQFGYPAGMPRQMAIPLPKLPAGTTQLRITTNQEIYWDRLFIAFQEPCPTAKRHPMMVQKAILEDIGFPKRMDFPQRRPYYDYSNRNSNWDSRLLEGNYTRFGDVMELLENKDNALAILGPGEGIHMEFPVPADPPADGWHRKYVLNSYGWCKDMDLYTNTGDTVGPLPGNSSGNKVKLLHEKYNYRFLAGRR